MIYEGIVKFIGEKESVGQNALPKQSFLVEEISDRDFKGSVFIDLIKEKTDLLNGVNVGDHVKVSLNFRTNEYKGKYYNSISAWKIEIVKKGNGKAPSQPDEDLPF